MVTSLYPNINLWTGRAGRADNPIQGTKCRLLPHTVRQRTGYAKLVGRGPPSYIPALNAQSRTDSRHGDIHRRRNYHPDNSGHNHRPGDLRVGPRPICNPPSACVSDGSTFVAQCATLRTWNGGNPRLPFRPDVGLNGPRSDFHMYNNSPDDLATNAAGPPIVAAMAHRIRFRISDPKEADWFEGPHQGTSYRTFQPGWARFHSRRE